MSNVWVPIGPSAPSAGVLTAYTQFNPTTGPFSTSFTAQIAMSAMAVTFIAPPSGSVLVKLTVLGSTQYTQINGNGVIVCGMYSAGAMVGSAQQLLWISGTTGTVNTYGRCHFSQAYTGLTPGNSYTFTPNFFSLNGNASAIYYGVGVTGALTPNPSYGPALTEVYSI
jgi:hypothetical protein